MYCILVWEGVWMRFIDLLVLGLATRCRMGRGDWLIYKDVKRYSPVSVCFGAQDAQCLRVSAGVWVPQVKYTGHSSQTSTQQLPNEKSTSSGNYLLKLTIYQCRAYYPFHSHAIYTDTPPQFSIKHVSPSEQRTKTGVHKDVHVQAVMTPCWEPRFARWDW